MLHDRERDQQRLQIEGFRGGVVLGEIDEGMVGALGQRRAGMGRQADDRRAPATCSRRRTSTLSFVVPEREGMTAIDRRPRWREPLRTSSAERSV